MTHDYQRLLQVGGFVEKVHASMCKAFDSASNSLTKGIDHIEKELTDPLETAAVGGFNEEIRQHVKSLPQDKRAEFLATAIRDGGSRVVNALLGAPRYLSGLPQSVHDHHVYMLRKK